MAQLTPKLMKKLADINNLMQDDQWDEALEEITAFTQQHSKIVEGWDLFMIISSATDNPYLAWRACRESSSLVPQFMDF